MHLNTLTDKQTFNPNYMTFSKTHLAKNLTLGNEILQIPKHNNFEIYQQETKDSCGLCSAKMIINKLLKDYHKNKSIQESDVIEESFLPKLKIFQSTIGIFPSQLRDGIQNLLDKNHLPYHAEIKKNISYEEIKESLKHGDYIIFSHMGDAINNPYRKKGGRGHRHNPHYFVLLSINEQEGTATIANPFGYEDTIFLKEFWERISLYTKFLHHPDNKLLPWLIKNGFYKPRSCVIVEKD